MGTGSIVGKGGMPTAVDVERLRQNFGVPCEGFFIAYDKLEEVLLQPRTSFRFKTVVHAWRKKLDRENNVLLEAVPGKGFVAMDGHKRVGYAARRYRSGLKRTHQAALVATRTERTGLSEDETRALDHIQLVEGRIRVLAATEARTLRYLPPTVEKAS